MPGLIMAARRGHARVFTVHLRFGHLHSGHHKNPHNYIFPTSSMFIRTFARYNIYYIIYQPPAIPTIRSHVFHCSSGCFLTLQFSGKSTRLLQRVREAEASGQRVVLVKSAVDTRYSVDHVVTHNGDKRPCVSLSQLRSLRERLGTAEYDKVDVVAVDEAQFIEGEAREVGLAGAG